MIHPSALVDPSAKIHSHVTIGAHAVIGPQVEIGEGTEIRHHASVEGPTKIGKNNVIFPYACVGFEPQDKKFKGELSRLEIGDENMLREFVTINRGTDTGGGITRIGNHNWIMAYCHVAHDCQVGNHVTMSNGSTLGGHVEVRDYAVCGGLTGIHQFCRVGEFSIVGAQSMVTQDVVPFVLVAGNRAKVSGLNYVGLERNGFTQEDITTINQAYRVFFLNGLTKDAAVDQMLKEFPQSRHIKMLVDFINESQRGVCR